MQHVGDARAKPDETYVKGTPPAGKSELDELLRIADKTNRKQRAFIVTYMRAERVEDDLESTDEDKRRANRELGDAYADFRDAACSFGSDLDRASIFRILVSELSKSEREELERQANEIMASDDGLPAGVRSQPVAEDTKDIEKHSAEWDVFISHASEDKEAFVRPLAEALQEKGIRVWYDEFTLTVGDGLRRSIDYGLVHSRYGIVIISPDFLKKGWPQRELDGLLAREVDGRKVILPVWHNVDKNTILQCCPLLADRVATSSDRGVDGVVADLMKAIIGPSK
jgi:hypothetical protein